MLTIRLFPMGKKHGLRYRVVVAEAKSKLTSDPTEVIGHFEPRSKTLVVEQDRLTYWLGLGAQPSDKVRQLCKLS